MRKVTVTFFINLTFFLLSSCTVSHVNSKINQPPTKSFVKILNTTNVKSCVDPSDLKCPIGIFKHTGSGMAINLVHDKMTVITAGHVCDVAPSKRIKEISQTIEVMDHLSNVHQAWPVLISHNNQKGSSDLCLLWVPTLQVEKINISKIEPVVGNNLYYIGAPLGIYHPPTVPIIDGIYSGIISPSSALVTSPAVGGSSGAAMLNYNNKIVGILWGVSEGFNSVSLMTNYKSFLIFIDKAKQKFD